MAAIQSVTFCSVEVWGGGGAQGKHKGAGLSDIRSL
jgi:hypothetical protein